MHRALATLTVFFLVSASLKLSLAQTESPECAAKRAQCQQQCGVGAQIDFKCDAPTSGVMASGCSCASPGSSSSSSSSSSFSHGTGSTPTIATPPTPQGTTLVSTGGTQTGYIAGDPTTVKSASTRIMGISSLVRYIVKRQLLFL